jgi:hypothetical protein
LFKHNPLPHEGVVLYTRCMRKREAAFTTRLRKWLLATSTRPRGAAYEIKVTTTNSIPFSDVSEHQLDALTQVSQGTFIYKIPDAGWQNPFDMFMLKEQEAWVVFAFLTARKKTKVWFIEVSIFKELQKNSKRKSVTHEMLLQAHEEYQYWCHLSEF